MNQNLEIIAVGANLAQTIGLLLGFYGVYFNVKKWKESQNIQLFLSLTDSFRKRWEGGWSDVLDKVVDKKGNIINKELIFEHEKEIRQMLNWIDWLGTLYKKNKLNDLEIITDSIGVTLIRIINAGHPIITQDINEEGITYWKSLIYIANILNIGWAEKIQ